MTAAPFLPMSRAEMDRLGWDACDVVLVTGDAYVDHPSFGVAVIGRVLEARGFRVGVIAQPDWHGAEQFRALGRPRVMFGVTAGNMDSMVNRYTSENRIRSDDAYSPGGAPGKRPDRAAIVYAQRCREAFAGVPVVLGGIEASLRRLAHYDYWSDKVRRSILLDAKADLLLYGNAERAVLEVATRLRAGEPAAALLDVRGVCGALPGRPREGWREVDARIPGTTVPARREGDHETVVRLPDFEVASAERPAFAQLARITRLEANPGCAHALVQRHGDRDVWISPPPLPLGTGELDAVYDLPYARRPHPAYGAERIPAFDMIRFSVTILRGCFGGCSFCSITEHEGRAVQSRSQASVLRELERVREMTPGFTGTISDLGGPTANMYRMGCKEPRREAFCRRPSCVWPEICPHLEHDHGPLVSLYRAARSAPGMKRVLVASGLRTDLAELHPEYVRELAAHHTGGRLKVAPEHSEAGPLARMAKPPIASFERFRALFESASRAAGKRQELVPYLIAAHPGTTDRDMLALALWLKRQGLRVEQVQSFLPSPMTAATAMYHTGIDPLHPVAAGREEEVPVPRGIRARRRQKAFLLWHDPASWPELREALREMGRAELIGRGSGALVPPGSATGPERTRPDSWRPGRRTAGSRRHNAGGRSRSA